MPRTAAEIRKAAEDARVRAAATLTPGQADLFAALAEEKEALEAEAAEQAKVRAIVMVDRVDAAREKAAAAPTPYLVEGVDLVGLFPLGKSPPPASLPGGGVIVIRNPEQAATDAFVREAEAKQKHASKMAIDLACACTVDPSPDGASGIEVRGFFERYQEAAGTVAQRARELGGARAREAKRGQG